MKKKHRSQIKIIMITTFIVTLGVLLAINFMNTDEQLEYKIQADHSVEQPAFAKLIGDLLSPPFVTGNKVETYLNGDEIFPAMLKGIRSAQDNITFESYIYWSGQIGIEFAKALAERARAGVRVHILLDWVGSGKISDEILDILKTPGIEVERYHQPEWYNITRLNHRTHRKILIIDGHTGYTGGVGIADEWTGNGLDPKHWRDTHYKVEGPVVNQMQAAFMDNWIKMRPEVHVNEKYFPTLTKKGDSPAQVFISSVNEGSSSVRIMYLMAIAAAQKSIHLESAYFVPDKHVIDQLIEAKKRGVEIKIIVPGPYNDSHVVDQASRELWGELLKEGIQIYEYQAALYHCKVMVVDRYFVSVGSTNFDERSFRLNDEANLNVLDKKFAERQIVDFERDLKYSKEVSYQEWLNRPLSEKIAGKVLSIVRSQL